MIDEDVLEELLASVGTAYEPPPWGPGDVVAAADSSERERARMRTPVRRRPSARTIAVAGGVAAVIGALAVSMAVPGSGDGSRARQVASSEGERPARLAGEGDDELRARAAAATADDTGFAAGSAASGDGSGGQSSGGATDLSALAGQVRTRVVRTGSLELEIETGSFDRAVERLSALAAGVGGYVAETKTVASDDDHATGSITIRVPGDDFDLVLAEVRRLGEVRSLVTSGKDVTAEYADVEARIRAKTAAREQLLLILAEARSIPDILAVQDRLNVVQLEIEQLQGLQNVLDDQTTYATLMVRLGLPPDPIEQRGDEAERSGLVEAWDDARHGFVSGLEWMIARSGTALLVVLTALALWLAGRFGWPRLRRRLL